jgi:hypothetical protein
MTETAKICVYCGSKAGRDGTGSTYAQDAEAIGNAIATRGFGLVYGGGNVGLMGLVADAVMDAGGETVGVIPRALEEKELAHRGVSELIVVEDMHQRKAIMAQRSVAFVALPGGYGTLEELFEVTAWAQLGFHQKPIGLLNTNGYFDHLLAFLDHAMREEFLRERHRALLSVESDPAALISKIFKLIP